MVEGDEVLAETGEIVGIALRVTENGQRNGTHLRVHADCFEIEELAQVGDIVHTRDVGQIHEQLVLGVEVHILAEVLLTTEQIVQIGRFHGNLRLREQRKDQQVSPPGLGISCGRPAVPPNLRRTT